MRVIALLFVLTLGAGPAFAQESGAPGLPDALASLLSAAHDSSDEDFEDAVRLIALTEDAQTVAAAAAALDPARGEAARALLGLTAPETAAQTAQAATSAPEPEPETAGGLRAAPMALAGALAEGRSEAWEGRAELGLRFDAGNSDRQDYTVALSASRALDVWGFEAGIAYAYSEVDEAVGRDEFEADARLERAAGETWTLFAEGDYERDALSGFDYSALLTAGAGYRVYDRPERAWTLRAAPGVRTVKTAAGETLTDPALEFSSDFEWRLAEPVRFTSDTSALISDSARAEQTFTLDTALGEVWSLTLRYQYTYEFDPEPGFENGDTRTDVVLVRLF